MATAAPLSPSGRPRQSVTIWTKSVLRGAPAAGDADQGDAVHDQLAVDEALAVQLDPGALLIDGLDADPDQNRLADPHRHVEAEGLGQVDGPGPGQDGADHGGAERGRQQAVGDAAAIGGFRGEGLVHMDRIEVIRGVGELLDALHAFSLKPERLELEIAGGDLRSGIPALYGNAKHAKPTPTPFTKPKREAKALNEEAAEIIGEEEEE